MGLELAEAPEDGLRHGYLRDALLLPVLSLQIEDRGELPQAPALGAQHQVDVALGRRLLPRYLVDRRLRFFRNRRRPREEFVRGSSRDRNRRGRSRRSFRRGESLATVSLTNLVVG